MLPVSLILTVAVSIVILAIGAGLMARHRSARALVISIGLAAIPVGLLLTGVTDLTLNGIRSLIDWFQRTPFTDLTAWGLGLSLGGLAVFVIGLFLPRPKPVERGAQPAQVEPSARQRRAAARQQAQPAVGQGAKPPAAPAAQGKPAAPSAPAAAQPAKPAQPQQQKGLDPEDAEIEALLKKRGIM